MKLFRLLVVCSAVVATLVVGPAGAADTQSLFFVDTFDQRPGATGGVAFDFLFGTPTPAIESVAITVPAGYHLPTGAVGAQLGSAEIDAQPALGGAATALKGSIVVADPATLAADPLAQTCAPGAHGAAWQLVLSGSASVSLPVTSDPLPSGGSSKLTICLDALRAANLVPTEVYLQIEDGVTNPSSPGLNRWTALATRFDAVGKPDPTTVFELRADEPLPHTLSVKASYDVKKRLLTVKGTLLAAGQPRDQIRVHVFGGPSSDPESFKELGAPVTSGAGAYTFHKRLAKAPKFVAVNVHFYILDCAEASTAPAGCASETIDGTFGGPTRVAVIKKKR
jgi:hypothetical protein